MYMYIHRYACVNKYIYICILDCIYVYNFVDISYIDIHIYIYRHTDLYTPLCTPGACPGHPSWPPCPVARLLDLDLRWACGTSQSFFWPQEMKHVILPWWSKGKLFFLLVAVPTDWCQHYAWQLKMIILIMLNQLSGTSLLPSKQMPSKALWPHHKPSP